LAEWDQVKKESAFGHDRLQGIARDVGLPECLELELRATATAGLLARGTLSAYLFAGPNNLARSSISFYLSRTTCHLMTPQDFGWQTQQAELRDLAANDWETVTVRLNRRAGRLLLLVDGAVKHRFEFPPVAAAAADERGLYFREIHSTMPTDAARLLVTPLPLPPAPLSTPPAPPLTPLAPPLPTPLLAPSTRPARPSRTPVRRCRTRPRSNRPLSAS
jgi:hypothetical protein